MAAGQIYMFERQSHQPWANLLRKLLLRDPVHALERRVRQLDFH